MRLLLLACLCLSLAACGFQPRGSLPLAGELPKSVKIKGLKGNTDFVKVLKKELKAAGAEIWEPEAVAEITEATDDATALANQDGSSTPAESAVMATALATRDAETPASEQGQSDDPNADDSDDADESWDDSAQAGDKKRPDLRIRLLSQDSERQVLSLDNRAKQIEYELREILTYRIRADRKPSAGDKRLVARRILYNPPEQLLGRSREELLLKQDMYRELSRKLINQLATLK